MDKTIVCIRRSDDINHCDYRLRDGELFYNKKEKYFLIGDGEKQLNQLTPFSSLVAGENGIVYAVRIDKNGYPHIKPVIQYHQNRIFEFRIDVNDNKTIKHVSDISVGDIAYWNGSTVKTVPLSNWNISLGTPVGVVVIGEGFAPDGKARIISLDSLGPWRWDSNGGYDTDTPVPNYNVFPITDNADSITTDSDYYGFLPSDRSDWTGVQSYVDPSTKYYYSNGNYIPSPYLGDSPNPAYYHTLEGGNAMSDFDGLGNTRILAELGSNYEAATACWNYNDATNGADGLQWYLPAMGELGYLMVRLKLINQSIQAVGGTVISVSVGKRLWGSSELYGGRDYYAYSLNINFGLVNNSCKDNDFIVRSMCSL